MKTFTLVEDWKEGTVNLHIDGKDTVFGYVINNLVEAFQFNDTNKGPEATADAIVDGVELFYSITEEEQVALRNMLLEKMYATIKG